MIITPQRIKRLKELPATQRIAVCKEDFALFISYYLSHYMTYPFAPFHYEWFQDIHDLIDGKITEEALVAYRESAKTSIALGLLLYSICYELYEYINVDSYDSVNAKRLLFDVVLELQTNKRILDDFGNIYNTKRSADEVTQKSVKDFVTNPTYDKDGNKIKEGIRVEAHSTGQPVRGRRHGAFRPQLLIIDDFENEQTIRSEAYTDEIHRHIQSFKGGLDSAKGRVLYLANYLSEFANVQSIIERSKVDEKLRVRIVPIADEDGRPTWPEKYGDGVGKVSIEALRKRMWTPENGDNDFMAEMMCRPIDYAHSKFKKEWFEQNRYMTPDLEGKALNTFITIDNAPSTNEKSDWIGCIVASVDPEDIWYLRYVKRYKMNTPALVEELFRLYNVYKPIKIGIEQNAFNDLIKPYLDKRAKELKIYPSFEELKHQGKRKEDRIQGALEGRFKIGIIKLLAFATDDTNELVRELSQFPHAKNDDLSDSLSYASQIAFAPGEIETKQPVLMSEYVKKHIEKVSERRQSIYETESDT